MANLDEISIKRIRFAEAVVEVCQRQPELKTRVFEGYRYLRKKEGAYNITDEVHLSADMDAAARTPDDPKYHDAKLTMIEALLQTWYKVRPDLKTTVMRTVENIALRNGEDATLARFDACQVLNDARNGQDVVFEKQEKSAAEHAKRRQLAAKREEALRKKRMGLAPVRTKYTLRS